MSHYLSHMAALAVNHTPVIQPRLASRFEGSAGVAPGEDFQEQVAEAPATRSKIAETPAENHALTPTVTEVQTAPGPTAIPAHTAPLLQAGVLPQVAQKAAEPVAPTNPAPKPQVLVQELIQERIHEQPLLVATPVPQNPTISATEKLQIEQHTEQSFFTEVRHEVAVPKAAEYHPSPVKTDIKPDAGPATNKTPQIQTRIATPEAAQPANRQHTQQIEAPIPAPNIQVSIGRIEIRANPASTSTTAKPRSAPASLSLDDYLKQRKGDR